MDLTMKSTMTDRMARTTFFLCLTFLMAYAQADGANPSNLEETLKKQQATIEDQQKAILELQERLHHLENFTEPGIDPAPIAITEPQMDLRPQFGLNLGVFGDINYSTKDREEDHHAFTLGEFDLYSTATHGTHLSFLTELVVELEGGSETELDLERLWVAYSFSDLLTIRAGKQHSALGFWNKTYHHGKQLFLTIDRPFFLAFEHDGGILPVHIVGIELEGALKLTQTRLKYELNLGNGPRIDQGTNTLIPNNASEDNNSKQWIIRLSARPDRYPGLTLGLFGTEYQVNTTAQGGLEELVAGIDLSYIKARLEFISEYFRFRNSQDHANAFYVQLGYSVFNSLTPYIRYEYLDVDPSDPYFSDLQNNKDRYQGIAGLRLDIDDLRSSLKIQYRRDDKKGDKVFNVFETQWSFSF